MTPNGKAERKDVYRGWKFMYGNEEHVFLEFGATMARVIGPDYKISTISSRAVLDAFTEWAGGLK